MTEVRLDLFQSPADMTCWMSGWNRRGHISHKQTHAQTNKLLPVFFFFFFYYVAGCFRQLCAAGRLHQHGRRDHSEKQLRENGEVACKKKLKTGLGGVHKRSDESRPPAQLQQLRWYQQQLIHQISYSLFLHLDCLIVSCSTNLRPWTQVNGKSLHALINQTIRNSW